jgi:hypothetical protein
MKALQLQLIAACIQSLRGLARPPPCVRPLVSSVLHLLSFRSAFGERRERLQRAVDLVLLLREHAADSRA